MPFHPSLPILLCGQTIPFNRCLRPFREARASIVGPDPQWCNWNIHVVYLSSSFYFLLLVRFSFISVILVSQYLIFSGISKGVHRIWSFSSPSSSSRLGMSTYGTFFGVASDIWILHTNYIFLTRPGICCIFSLAIKFHGLYHVGHRTRNSSAGIQEGMLLWKRFPDG